MKKAAPSLRSGRHLVALLAFAIPLRGEAQRLYVSNERSRDVSVIDVASRKELARIRMPGRPRGIQSSPDGRKINVANRDD